MSILGKLKLLGSTHFNPPISYAQKEFKMEGGFKVETALSFF